MIEEFVIYASWADCSLQDIYHSVLKVGGLVWVYSSWTCFLAYFILLIRTRLDNLDSRKKTRMSEGKIVHNGVMTIV